MTIAEIGGIVKNISSRRSDRGGISMNLIGRLLLQLNYNNRKEYGAEDNKNVHDHGYALYQALEYGYKYPKEELVFGANLLKYDNRIV